MEYDPLMRWLTQDYNALDERCTELMNQIKEEREKTARLRFEIDGLTGRNWEIELRLECLYEAVSQLMTNGTETTRMDTEDVLRALIHAGNYNTTDIEEILLDMPEPDDFGFLDFLDNEDLRL